MQQVLVRNFGDKHCISGVIIIIPHKHSHYILIQQIVNLVHQIKHLIVSHLIQDLIIWDLEPQQEVRQITTNYFLGAYNSHNIVLPHHPKYCKTLILTKLNTDYSLYL